MHLVYLGLAWILGICLGLSFDWPWPILASTIAGSVLFSIAFRRRKAAVWMGLCFTIFLGGFLRSQAIPEGDALSAYRGFYEMRGVVAADPDVRTQSTILRIEARQIRQPNGAWEEISGTALLYAPIYPAFDPVRRFPYYRYGDLLQVKGTLQSPRSAEGKDQFDLKEYLFRQGVYSVMDSPCEIALVGSGQKPVPMELIYRLRGRISQALGKVLPAPECALAEAMLLGKRSALPSDVKEDFSRSGLSHLLAISGVHVTIVAGMVLSASAWVFGRRRPVYLLATLGVLWGYVLLSGMGAAAVRAAIMASLWLWGEWLGRPRSALNALVFAGALMTALDPRLPGNIGFQLSFAAMAGIILLTPIFQNWGRRLPGKPEDTILETMNFLLASFAMSLGAVLATLPLIAYHFHTISLMSLPATLFALPAVPAVIVSSAAVGLVGILSTPIAEILGWVCWLPCRYVLGVADFFSALPFASLQMHIGLPSLAACYGTLATVLWVRPKHLVRAGELLLRLKAGLGKTPALASRIPFKALAVFLIIGTTLIWTAALTVSDSKLHVYILDVGQGDSILIRKGNQEILIDGGPDATGVCRGLGEALPFWDRSIELVVLTHPDSDHLTGLIEVMRRYRVKQVITGPAEATSGAFIEWRRLLDERGIEPVRAEAGMEILMSGGHLTVLHPEEALIRQDSLDSNESSVVLRLEYGNFSLLLPADIGTETERHLLREDQKLQSTVLKVAHHGSDTSTSAEFLNEVHPLVAVISVGANNLFGHPSETVLSLLRQVTGEKRLFLTSRDGTVELITDGEKLWIQTER